jgi:hypothetical protein
MKFGSKFTPCQKTPKSLGAGEAEIIVKNDPEIQNYFEAIRKKGVFAWHFEGSNQPILPPPSATPGPSIFPPHVVVTRADQGMTIVQGEFFSV